MNIYDKIWAEYPPTNVKLDEIDPIVIDRPGTIDLEKEKIMTKKPPMYNVVLHNDDFTPAEFVVEVLQKFFGYTLQQGIQLMIDVHRSGKGIIGTFSKDVAESKAKQANDYATAHEHPLQLTVEEAHGG